MEDTLIKLDEYFAEKKQKSLYFIGAFAVICYFFYMTVFPLTQSFEDDALSALNSANSNLNRLEDPAKLEAQIKNKTINLEDANKKLADLKADDKFLSKEISDLSKSFFDANGVNPFLDHLALEAKKEDIALTEIINGTQPMQPLKFERMYDVNLTFAGANFPNVVRYVNTLERTNNLVDINFLDINVTQNKLSGRMNVISWGVKN